MHAARPPPVSSSEDADLARALAASRAESYAPSYVQSTADLVDDDAGGAHRGACAAGGGTNLEEEWTHVGFAGGAAPGTNAGAAASTLVAPGR